MMTEYGIYKNGELRKTYSDIGKALIALAMAKDIQPEHQWGLKEINEPEREKYKCEKCGAFIDDWHGCTQENGRWYCDDCDDNYG